MHQQPVDSDKLLLLLVFRDTADFAGEGVEMSLVQVGLRRGYQIEAEESIGFMFRHCNSI